MITMILYIIFFRSYYSFIVLCNKSESKLMQQSVVSLPNESWLRLDGL